jgi:hypothetical protein
MNNYEQTIHSREVAFASAKSFLDYQYCFDLNNLNNYLRIVIGVKAINSAINSLHLLLLFY